MQSNNNTFTELVRNVVREIPRGRTMSYKTVAEKAGNPKASRAVARIMSANYDPEIPCHRVICSNGALGGYNRGGILAKKKLLESEKLSC
jgi:methylated-DNA-[protein]-cysteine S-methyltransferase